MFEILTRGRGTNGARVERFGELEVPTTLAEEILSATPERKSRVLGIRDRLEYMAKEEKRELVDRILVRFTLWVFDLPASERNHHSGRFGLLDHSLEVAARTVFKLAETSFRVSEDPVTNHRECPAWVYAGLVASLAHDLGKIHDLEVSLPGGSDRWEAGKEPLAAFCRRHGRSGTEPDLWKFLRGRGLHGHKARGRAVLPLLLTPEACRNLGRRLESILDPLLPPSDTEAPPAASEPARVIVELIRRYDQESARVDYSQRKALPVSNPRLEGSAPPSRDPSGGQEPASDGAPLQTPAPASPMPRQEPSPPPPAPAIETALPDAPEDLSEETSPLAVADEDDLEFQPSARERRGDPMEMDARLRRLLDPAVLLETLRIMITSRKFSRNSEIAEVFIRPDYVWFVFPEAFKRLARFGRVPYDSSFPRRILRALAHTPGVVPDLGGRVFVSILPWSHVDAVRAARIRTQGFLPESEVMKLGISSYEVIACPGTPLTSGPTRAAV